MKSIKLFFLLSSILLFTTSSIAQKLIYKVKVDGRDSGSLIAVKSGKKSNYQFSLQSKIKTTKIISIEINYELKSIFENGKLKSSNLIQYVNGIKQVENSTSQQGDHYIFKDISGNQKTISENILTAIPELYFTEPKNKNKIWSDNQGNFLPIKKIGANYQLITGENQNSIYTYEKGVCKKVETTQAFSTITFELVQ
ncbi:MAG: DUF6134 family protein [Bacteroidota bacterium]